MRSLFALSCLLSACAGPAPLGAPPAGPSNPDVGAPDAAASPLAGADAGFATLTADGGLVTLPAGCIANERGPSDAGPPDAGLAFSAGLAPSRVWQSTRWMATGAPGCDEVIPHEVPPRLSFTTPAPCDEATAVDGEGNLTLAWNRAGPDWRVDRAYFTSDGSAGAVVTSQELLVAARARGFIGGDINWLSGEEWYRITGPEGGYQGYAGEPFVSLNGTLWPDPRGGYVQTRVSSASCASSIQLIYELRWLDAELHPRTPWRQVTTWSYSYNVLDRVLVDRSGSALVLIYFDPPMSMPCPGNLSFNAWVSPEGAIAELETPPPSYRSGSCSDLQGGSYGEPVALDDGFAFYYRPSKYAPVTGWWARFRSGQTRSEAPPAWLSSYGPGIQRLPSGAFLTAADDPRSCARTAKLLGSAGQLCATLPLEGSADCTFGDMVWPDGTFAIANVQRCTTTWWPALGRAR